MADVSGPSRGSQLLVEWRGAGLAAHAAKLLDLDPASYSRFENGIRKPSAELSFRIERLTDGKVPAKSWYEPPTKRREAKAS